MLMLYPDYQTDTVLAKCFSNALNYFCAIMNLAKVLVNSNSQ